MINIGQGGQQWAKINVPSEYDTVWVRVLGDRWTALRAESGVNGRWIGGWRRANCYCPDGSLSDGESKHHQWMPIPTYQRRPMYLRSWTEDTNAPDEFWLSGLAFSRNPWNHATQSAVGYYWAVNGGDRVEWDTHEWNNDVLARIPPNTNKLLKVPVVPSGRDKLLYLVEHNNNWNGCMHSGITVGGKRIERFTATYDNPFVRHWNSKRFERYVAARIPASLIPSGATHLDVRIDMTNQDAHIYFREIGTHDLDVPE